MSECSHPASDRRTATLVSIAAVVVLIASVMPWAKLPASSILPSVPGVFPGAFPGMMLQNVQVVGTAWNGNLRLFGVTWPHSLVVLAAIALAALTWLQATGNWQPPRELLLGLAGYGLFHTAWFTVNVLGSGTIGIGALLTLAAFAASLRELILAPRRSLPGSPPPLPPNASS